jgi:hypothetical protein
MDRSCHFILLSMKRWLLVDGNAKQPELFVEPVFRQNLFIVYNADTSLLFWNEDFNR